MCLSQTAAAVNASAGPACDLYPAPAGASKGELAKSPFLEKLLQKDLEVVFMTEAIDEYVMSHLTEFDDKKFQDASKDNLKLGKDDKKAAKVVKARPGRVAPGACAAPLQKNLSLGGSKLKAVVKELLQQGVTGLRTVKNKAASAAHSMHRLEA